MSKDVEAGEVASLAKSRRTYVIALLAVSAIVVVVAVPVFLFSRSVTPVTTAERSIGQENAEEDFRNALANETDLITLKNGLQSLNSYYGQLSQRPAGLTAKQRDQLQTLVALDPEELTEIDSSVFTTLDANYLDLCFLLRDAARALQVDTASGSGEDAAFRLRQATAAFNWVVRQMRAEQTNRPTFPPQFALRRGRGTALERSLVFLELLRQFNRDGDKGPALTGCVLVEPASANDLQRIWAVGVVIDKDLYLFDPNLGLPIPGADGKSVATLADALKDPKVLGQLTVNQKHPYDVGPEKLRSCDVQLCVSLSALAPRLEFLQKKVLGSHLRVTLAANLFGDNGEEAAVQTALRTAGLETAKVRVQPQALRVLRAFLPVDEGGADSKPFGLPLNLLPGFVPANETTPVTMYRKRYFDMEIIPWTGLPEEFRRFPPNVGLGSLIRDRYAKPFRQSIVEPKGARDLVLRGRYSQVIKDLMEERKPLTEDYRNWQKEVKEAGGDRAFSQKVIQFFSDEMIPASANLERAKREDAAAVTAAQVAILKLWDANAEVNALLTGSVAAQRRPQVTYLLALAKQEQAEQLQQRLPANVASRPGEAAAATAAWKAAEEWWRHYADEFPNGEGIATMRRQRGRCQMMSGNWQAAVATWEDVADPVPTLPTDRMQPLTPLEKVGSLYLADHLRKQHEAGTKP